MIDLALGFTQAGQGSPYLIHFVRLLIIFQVEPALQPALPPSHF